MADIRAIKWLLMGWVTKCVWEQRLSKCCMKTLIQIYRF